MLKWEKWVMEKGKGKEESREVQIPDKKHNFFKYPKRNNAKSILLIIDLDSGQPLHFIMFHTDDYLCICSVWVRFQSSFYPPTDLLTPQISYTAILPILLAKKTPCNIRRCSQVCFKMHLTSGNRWKKWRKKQCRWWWCFVLVILYCTLYAIFFFLFTLLPLSCVVIVVGGNNGIH